MEGFAIDLDNAPPTLAADQEVRLAIHSPLRRRYSGSAVRQEHHASAFERLGDADFALRTELQSAPQLSTFWTDGVVVDTSTASDLEQLGSPIRVEIDDLRPHITVLYVEARRQRGVECSVDRVTYGAVSCKSVVGGSRTDYLEMDGVVGLVADVPTIARCPDAQVAGEQDACGVLLTAVDEELRGTCQELVAIERLVIADASMIPPASSSPAATVLPPGPRFSAGPALPPAFACGHRGKMLAPLTNGVTPAPVLDRPPTP